MRKVFCVLLTLFLLMQLCSCRSADTEKNDAISFYYLRSDIIYGSDEGVIAPEPRQISGIDLEGLLTLYLRGPVDAGLVSPFPAGTKLVSLELMGTSLTVQLSIHSSTLSDLDHTLACACLAKTCFDFGGVSEITIRVADTDRIITLTPESLTLTDSSDTIHATIGTEAPIP